MPNMSLTKIKMPEQSPDIRNANFKEVTLGYTPEMAIEEAERCINCKKPLCVDGCPVNVAIPEFITYVKAGEFEKAYETVTATNALPAVCGRVCPQETQCEELCIRGKKGMPVGIGYLERFVADWHIEHVKDELFEFKSNGHKVAVVGSGPSGLICAADLAKLGYEVTIFEAFHATGGVLIYGIPEFRLPKRIVSVEINKLLQLGVKIQTNMVIGKIFSIDDLFADGFEAIFVGSGAGLPTFMKIPGENLNGVYSANEFLTRTNLMKAYDSDYDTPIMDSRSVAVVGGGNVAMDAARCAKRLGAEKVYIVYRRSEVEMPARVEEVHHAKEEGIIFRLLTAPVQIIGDDKGQVAGMECIEMELGEPDASGRRRPVEKAGSNYVIDVDTAIIAIGTSPNPLIKMTTPGLETNKWGCIVADEISGLTSREGVFAGGDAVTGAATVILAMGAGKNSAVAIDEYIRSKNKA
jgi:glutamate synthase (NADPH/NADH) small chain